jgi:hypothetical protein
MDALAGIEEKQRKIDPGRAPLPAGDKTSWSLLLAGTILEGLPWPGWGSSGWDSPIARGAE